MFSQLLALVAMGRSERVYPQKPLRSQDPRGFLLSELRRRPETYAWRNLGAHVLQPWANIEMKVLRGGASGLTCYQEQQRVAIFTSCLLVNACDSDTPFPCKTLQECDAKRDHPLYRGMLESLGPILKNHFLSTWILVALITQFSSVEL